jgi:hypothetical protein|tara:strand:- start:3087 stop:3524 length:438 start_codon:yes stop_codon:yes gene_type:complete
MSEKSKALDHVWWIEYSSEKSTGYHVPSIAVAKVTSADTTTNFTTATSGKSVRIYGSVYDEDFVESGTGIALTEEPNIPSQFHEGLVHYVIMKGYENKMSAEGSMQKAGYFRNYWNLCIKMGTQYGNRNFDNTGFSIKPADGFLM